MLSCTYIKTSKLSNIAATCSGCPFPLMQLPQNLQTQQVPLPHCRVAESAMLGECLTELAKKYPQSKFVKIISTECIPNYPDKNVPTVLIYKDTKCLQHLIGLAAFGGSRTTPERKYLTSFNCISLFQPNMSNMSVCSVCMLINGLSVKDDGQLMLICRGGHFLEPFWTNLPKRGGGGHASVYARYQGMQCFCLAYHQQEHVNALCITKACTANSALELLTSTTMLPSIFHSPAGTHQDLADPAVRQS